MITAVSPPPQRRHARSPAACVGRVVPRLRASPSSRRHCSQPCLGWAVPANWRCGNASGASAHAARRRRRKPAGATCSCGWLRRRRPATQRTTSAIVSLPGRSRKAAHCPALRAQKHRSRLRSADAARAPQARKPSRPPEGWRAARGVGGAKRRTCAQRLGRLSGDLHSARATLRAGREALERLQRVAGPLSDRQAALHPFPCPPVPSRPLPRWPRVTHWRGSASLEAGLSAAEARVSSALDRVREEAAARGLAGMPLSTSCPLSDQLEAAIIGRDIAAVRVRPP
jgi:hypothetical protein